MKKLFLITVSLFLLSSCVSTKLVEYNEEGNCVPTIAGYQKKVNLERDNPDTRYFWIQCRWMTESQVDSIVNDFVNNPTIVDMD